MLLKGLLQLAARNREGFLNLTLPQDSATGTAQAQMNLSTPKRMRTTDLPRLTP